MLRTLILILLMFVTCPVKTQGKTVLIETWTPQTHLALAHCMLAEGSKRDHVAIAYAARNRWQLRRKMHPQIRYVDILRGYCSIHKVSHRKRHLRPRWIKQLGFPKRDGTFDKPEDFPRKKPRWSKIQRLWFETLQRAWNWNQGKYRDPCKGKAVFWGAPQDPNNIWYLPSDEPSDKLKRLKCSDKLDNDFYRYKTKEELSSYSGKRI